MEGQPAWLGAPVPSGARVEGPRAPAPRAKAPPPAPSAEVSSLAATTLTPFSHDVARQSHGAESRAVDGCCESFCKLLTSRLFAIKAFVDAQAEVFIAVVVMALGTAVVVRYSISKTLTTLYLRWKKRGQGFVAKRIEHGCHYRILLVAARERLFVAKAFEAAEIGDAVYQSHARLF